MARVKEQGRRCLASGNVKPKCELIRFVIDPDGRLTPDLAGKLPGRGLWVSCDRESLKKAVTKNLFSRAARQAVIVDADLVERVEALLLTRAQSAIGMARKSGASVAGFTKVESALRRHPPLALLEASDGSADGRRKLINLAKAWQNDEKSRISVIGCLTSGELGLAFGRGSVIHAALTNSGAANKALAELNRLCGFRPMIPSAWQNNEPETCAGEL
jgi:predicted RNA-binding protein YlxR (DUF448 family)